MKTPLSDNAMLTLREIDTHALKESQLMEWGQQAFCMARSLETTPANVSGFVAVTVGKQAKRLGFTEKELSNRLQSAYGGLWVKQSNLNPGLDLKEVWKVLLKALQS